MQVENENMLLFWQPDSIYSNWYDLSSTPFILLDKSYKNSEAAFIYLKAREFNDHGIMKQIDDRNQSPGYMKSLGRRIQGFEEGHWDSVKCELMYLACKAKFEQSPSLRQTLLLTGNKELVEASPFDKIWGIGLAPNDPRAFDKSKWLGENLLGKVLMRIRDEFNETNLKP